MKYLFVHQNFPGQFLHLVRHLTSMPGNEVLFATEPNDNALPGVRKFVYNKPLPTEETFPDAQEFELALRRATIVQDLARRLNELGFIPDIVIGHHGWGELLNIGDIWPGVPVLGYFEFFYHTQGIDVGFDPEFPPTPGSFANIRAKNAVNLLALNNPGHGQTPTRFQLETYPEWARSKITVLPEGVDLLACRPMPAIRRKPLDLDDFRIEPTDTLVTFVSRDLEPYRGFHTMLRAIPRLHRYRSNLKVVLVGGDGVSYGGRLIGTTWRAHLMEQVGAMIDPARICFPGRVSYSLFLQLLQRSDAHVYLTYPFVLSWSLREALACGCAIVGSDTAPVREFITHRKTGLLVAFPDTAALGDGIEEVLEDKPLASRMRRNARQLAERTLQMDEYLNAYQTLISDLIERGVE